jgi:hypothetical protein
MPNNNNAVSSFQQEGGGANPPPNRRRWMPVGAVFIFVVVERAAYTTGR